MALNLSKLKKGTTNEEPQVSQVSNINPTTQPGFRLSLQNNKTYDLDELIQIKLRDNSNATLVLRTITNEELKTKLIEYVTKKILDDYRITWDETNYKTQIQYVEQFDRVFDLYFNRYYDEYKKVITSDNYNGSISIDTIFRHIKLTKEDIRKYTLGDVAANQDNWISIADKNRALVLWTDGSPDTGEQAASDLSSRVDELYRLYEELSGQVGDIGSIIDEVNGEVV
jgi:hypothetical protein